MGTWFDSWVYRYTAGFMGTWLGYRVYEFIAGVKGVCNGCMGTRLDSWGHGWVNGYMRPLVILPTEMSHIATRSFFGYNHFPKGGAIIYRFWLFNEISFSSLF